MQLPHPTPSSVPIAYTALRWVMAWRVSSSGAARTVNVAARVQALVDSRAILATRAVVADPQASALLETNGLTPTAQRRALRGIADKVPVYEIP